MLPIWFVGLFDPSQALSIPQELAFKVCIHWGKKILALSTVYSCAISIGPPKGEAKEWVGQLDQPEHLQTLVKAPSAIAPLNPGLL